MIGGFDHAPGFPNRMIRFQMMLNLTWIFVNINGGWRRLRLLIVIRQSLHQCGLFENKTFV